MAENIDNNGYSQRDSAEHEGYAKALRSFNRIWKERDSAQPKLLEAILYKDNFNRAYKRVKANKGAPGIDGMTIEEALPYLKEHQQELTDRIYRGKFSVNKNSPNKDMAMEFMRFLISDEELGNMASVKGLITTARDFSPDSVYAALSETPQDRKICSTEANINDQAIKQFRSAAHQVLVGEMTVDDAIASYGKD